MKSIAFITRVHPKRSRMLNLCIQSVKAQINDDYIHILNHDDRSIDGYGTFQANKSFAKIKQIDAKYVMVLDDDDMLIDDCFVGYFSNLIKDKNPEIIFFKGSVEGRGIYPRPEIWGKAPRYGLIASFCFAIRLDVWKKNIHTFGNRQFGGDYCFIAACYKNTTEHLWIDRLVASTQKGPGRGQGEINHGQRKFI